MSWASSEAVRKTMLGNTRRDTRPELAVRSALHALGYRYRVDYRVGTVAARPDIVLTKRRVAVFIDGCFWHGCPWHGTRPKTHPEYWLPKLERNRARDRTIEAGLAAEGWVVLRFWEHEEPLDVVAQVVSAAGPPNGFSTGPEPRG